MTAVLKITDGTTVIDLLNKDGFGFILSRWRPAIAAYKGGGLFQSSPLAGGRRLVSRQFDNAIETFSLKANDVEQDALIRDLQEIRRLLEKATDYWATDWQGAPVWIETQATQETNARFAIIHTGRIPEDENPFAQPFLQPNCAATMDNLTLVIERGHWRDTRPDVGTEAAISAVETYDGRNLGNVNSAGVRTPTTAEEVYVANKRNEANLTDVWWWDQIGGAWSPANLLDTALPYDLLPNPIRNGDSIYFGIDTSLADSGPFCSLVFDLVVALSDPGGDVTTLWEYSRGAGVWATLVVQDNTDNDGAMTGDAFDTLGVNSVHWEHPHPPTYFDWATDNPNPGVPLGITGYWVRCVFTVGGGATPVPPRQGNRNVYSVTWPYVEVASTVVGGDIPALLRARFRHQSTEDVPVAPDNRINRVIAGLRTYNRGANFSAYINFAHEQNPTGVTITTPDANTNEELNIATATGRQVRWNIPGAPLAMTTRWIVHFNSTIIPEYYGIYHVYLRGQQDGGVAGGVIVQLRYLVTDPLGIQLLAATSPSRVFHNTLDFQTLDFGKVTIPPAPLKITELIYEFQIVIRASNSDATPPDLKGYDLILMPVDEWAGDFLDPHRALVVGHLNRESYLDIDSVTYPKRPVRAVAKDISNLVYDNYMCITGGPAVLQANAKQRLWFFCIRGSATTAESEPYSTHTLLASRSNRYLSMRGSR